MTQSTAEGRRIARGLGILQLFIGLGAIAGGLGLALDPSGASLGMPLAWLRTSPFSDYLVPGLFLLLVHGVGTGAGSFASFRRHRLAGEAAIVLGAVMMVWIVVQVWWIQQLHWLHPLYFGLGVLELALGLRLRRNEQQLRGGTDAQ